MTYKRHYSLNNETLCGLDVSEGQHMHTTGQENVERVTCQNCQKSILANAGDMVKLVDGVLALKR